MTAEEFARAVGPFIAACQFVPKETALDAAKLGTADGIINGAAGVMWLLETNQIESAKHVLRDLGRILGMSYDDVMKASAQNDR